MKCPVCKDPNLVMADRQGIEIDYCPECRGVWLDRGELDKIIERSAPEAPAAQPQPARPSRPEPQPYYHQQDLRSDQRRDDYHHHRPHKKKSLLGELFDF